MAKTPEVRQSPVSIGFKVTKVFFLSFSVGFLGAHAPAVLATSDFWDQGQWTEQLSYTPTVEYWNVDLEGWKLYVHPSVLQNREKWRKLVADLQERLAEARRILPEKIYIGLMQSTIFWIETSNPSLPQTGMVFHVSADWLRLNGLNPEKAGHIEITNIDILLELLGQGNEVVLQLLMNAYRLKMVPKPLSDGIIAAYAKALEDRRYESVPHRDGDNRRAPALFLASTYFAELSEAYLDSNEYYPFIRSDIAQYDPYVFPILSQIWGD